MAFDATARQLGFAADDKFDDPTGQGIDRAQYPTSPCYQQYIDWDGERYFLLQAPLDRRLDEGCSGLLNQDEADSRFQVFLANPEEEACTFLLGNGGVGGKEGVASQTLMSCIRLSTDERTQQNRQGLVHSLRTKVVPALLLILALLTAYSFFGEHSAGNGKFFPSNSASSKVEYESPRHGDWWQRFDTSGSEGPRYDLNLHHHNVSDFTNSEMFRGQNWTVRLDDQTIVPTALIDEEEVEYQKYMKKRYPEWQEVVEHKNHVSETWLHDPDSILIPADQMFHVGHCVRVFRRYWQAKETGRHVCPRDIDYRHVPHPLAAHPSFVQLTLW